MKERAEKKSALSPFHFINLSSSAFKSAVASITRRPWGRWRLIMPVSKYLAYMVLRGMLKALDAWLTVNHGGKVSKFNNAQVPCREYDDAGPYQTVRDGFQRKRVRELRWV